MAKKILTLPFNIIIKWPLLSFFISLLLLFGAIFAVDKFSTKPITVSPTITTKKVKLYDANKDAFISIQAKVTEAPTITIYAQTTGIVADIYKKIGQQVSSKDVLLTINTNNAGDNVSDIQAQLAQLQFEGTNESLGKQKDAIDLQKELLETDGIQPKESENKITFKQLEAQEIGLVTGASISKLQLQLAQIQQSASNPVAGISGRIEKIHVTKNQLVSQGAPLMTISTYNNTAKLTAQVTSNLVKIISLSKDSNVIISNEPIKIFPNYLTKIPTSNNLFELSFTLWSEAAKSLAINSYVEVSVPINTIKPESFFIPLEAVHQTNNDSIVYVSKNGVAQARNVKLGVIAGSFVEILSGLPEQENIIITRNVVNGDKISS